MTAEPQRSTPRVLADSPRVTLAVYAAAIFLSAALLFAVQPLFAKMVLPRLGGSPSVWSVAMVFFQAVLLGGYAYAHVLTRYAPGRPAVIIHVAVLIVATFALPLSIAAGWGRPPLQGETVWLLGLFAASIGLPFFALSANGPLLQAWFARTGHPSARDPYFLYAASNIGSFLALISYPLLVEPLTRLGGQTRGWSIAFYVLIALIAGCGVLLLRSPNTLPATSQEGAVEAPPAWRDAAIWVALAAVPAGLLIAVTAHISTDVAASPMLWVIPLALYLATFVIVFQTRPLLPHRWTIAAEPAFIILLMVVLVFGGIDYIFLTVGGNILAFVVIALACHGELARRRPAARYLTAFYMWMSTGGMIGGIAAGLVAPHVFSWVAEYPILIVLAVLCRPGFRLDWNGRDLPAWLALLALALLVALAGPAFGTTLDDTRYKVAIGVLLAVAALFWWDPLKFAVVIALAFVTVRLYDPDAGVRDSVRSFFGVHKIIETTDGQFRTLQHGTTEHGAQRIRDANGKPATGRPEPLTYYHYTSPIAQGIKAARERKGAPIRLAVVGLGTGSTACLTEPGDKLTYYEIDPVVLRIAKDPSRFTFLSACAPAGLQVVMGDARLTLADAPDGAYDVLVVDAFTSDAIPVHLVTREAMALYAKKIAPDGMIMMHVSNRHMELASVVAGIAEANGLVTWVNDGSSDEDEANYKFSSTVCAVARSDDDFGNLSENDDWKLQEVDEHQWVWTDDYSNIIGAMIRQLKK